MEKKGINYLNFNRYRDTGGYGLNNSIASSRSSYARYASPYNYPARHTPARELNSRTVPVARKKIVKKKIPVIYQKIKDKSLKIGMATYIYAAVIFSGMMLLIALNASCEAKKNSVEALKNEIKTLKEANSDARAALAASYDENEIAALAQEMGMRKPKQYQIKYIKVPKESYAKGGGVTEPAATDAETPLDWFISIFGAD